MEQQGSWDKYLSLIEFAYNNSYHASIGMASYEVFYGRRCQSPLYWHELGKASLLDPDLVRQTTKQVKKIRNKIITS